MRHISLSSSSELKRVTFRFSGVSFVAILLFANVSQAQVTNHPTGGQFNPPSPTILNPFTVELRPVVRKLPLAGGESDLAKPEFGGVLPNGTVYPQVTGKDALTTYRNSLERIVALQQRNSANNVQFPPKHYYVLRAKQSKHIFHPHPPYNMKGGTVIWGYDGTYPGPTFFSRHGEPLLVRIFNDLYFNEQGKPRPEGELRSGFGEARISTHLHNGHTASESDGNPGDLYPPVYDKDERRRIPEYPNSIKNLWFRDHHYAMFRAGLDPSPGAGTSPPNKDDGDPRESISTLWYHDHSNRLTAANTYKGLVGVHLVFDEVDSGNENDTSPNALRLPSGPFDIPLLIQDKYFKKDDGIAQLAIPTNPGGDQTSGLLGDVIVVNGQITPKLTVQRRKYRFRLINGGPSRFYKFFLTKRLNQDTVPEDRPFFRIGNDETLLAERYSVPASEGLLLAVAERADVIVDFSEYEAGDRLYFVNRLVMFDDGESPKFTPPFTEYETLKVDGVKDEGDYVIRFDVVGGKVNDPSRNPEQLRKQPQLPSYLFDAVTGDLKRPDTLKDPTKTKNHRDFKFNFGSEGWVVNGRLFQTSPAGSTKKGLIGKLDVPRYSLVPGNDSPDGEVWTIKNLGTWAHPVHIHLEEFQILWRNTGEGNRPEFARRPPIYEQCRKDVLRLDPGEEVQIFIRFRDFLGKYPIHCHNVLHEDHEMMLRFDVVGDN